MGAALTRLARLVCVLVLLVATWARADGVEDESLIDRPISKVTLVGLSRIGEQEVKNNMRVAADAKLLPDGTVEVTYLLVEQMIVEAIQTVGNKALSDQELRAAIPLYPGGPRDDFLLQQSVFKIKELY